VNKQARIIGKMADHGNNVMFQAVQGMGGVSIPFPQKRMSTGVVEVYLESDNVSLTKLLVCSAISPQTYFLTWDNNKQASLSVAY